MNDLIPNAKPPKPATNHGLHNLHTRIKSPIPNKNKKISVTKALNYKRASASWLYSAGASVELG